MFTGIVSEIGRVAAVSRDNQIVTLRIDAPAVAGDVKQGDSVAVNGVCLTVVDTTLDAFEVEVVQETVDRSSMASLSEGSLVNLERPMSATGRFDGHIVQGHVDGVCEVTAIEPEGDSLRMTFSIPSDLSQFVVEKGSICLDGTSLTIADLSSADASEQWVSVAVIPHTLDSTVFGHRRIGDLVNCEVDVLAKYVARMVGRQS